MINQKNLLFFHSVSQKDSLSDIISDILSDINSNILSDIDSDLLSDIDCDILSDLLFLSLGFIKEVQHKWLLWRASSSVRPWQDSLWQS